ncbi:MAG: LemA family protein [Deltaproteobacteria bacterium]|nr:LemA family protein [Deltaproteobacteria bacterium]
MSVLFLGLLIVVGIFILWAIGAYNGLVRKRNEVDNAWAQIDVQLKRRTDLVPNLVETVKGYATHERETLDRVIQARNATMNAGSVEQRVAAENALTGALKSLFAVAEAYPDLKANQNFMQLQEELTSTENKVAYARQFYNDQILGYNTAIEVFPTSIIAGMFHFTRRQSFAVTTEAEREAPKVKFG